MSSGDPIYEVYATYDTFINHGELGMEPITGCDWILIRTALGRAEARRAAICLWRRGYGVCDQERFKDITSPYQGVKVERWEHGGEHLDLRDVWDWDEMVADA